MLGGLALAVMTALATSGAAPAGALRPDPFLAGFNTVTTVASTVPANGDVNPYGIVNVPQTVGSLVRGDTLVSNFNAKSNLQGTGTTIVQIAPDGQQSVFAQLDGPLPGACPGGVGLTTALTVLQGGIVVVGSLPVTMGGMGKPEAGCLIVLDSHGTPLETFSGGDINGPWDMTAFQVPGFAVLFVTNVLNGTVAAKGAPVNDGTVVRLVLALPHGAPPRPGRLESDRFGLCRAAEHECVGDRANGRRAGTERDALRRRHPEQPDRGHPSRPAAAERVRRGRVDRVVGLGAQRSVGTDVGSQRRPDRGQRGQRRTRWRSPPSGSRSTTCRSTPRARAVTSSD